MAAVSEYCVLVLLLGAFAFGILSRAADLSTVEYATITVLPFDDGSTDQSRRKASRCWPAGDWEHGQTS